MKAQDLLLYAITDCAHYTGQALIDRTKGLLDGGITMLQFRDKTRGREAARPDAEALLALCRAYRVPFIVNDDVELAREIGADGVHLGQDDAALRLARIKLGPDKIIGISAHNLAEAREAQAGGASYLGCGAIFPSQSKDAACLAPGVLKEITDTIDLPVVAIGGITGDNLGQLTGLGCDGAAVISALYGAEDPLAATKALRVQAEAVFGPYGASKPQALIIPLDRVLCDTHAAWAALAETYLTGVGKAAGPDLAAILRQRTLAASAAYIKHNYSVPDGISQILYEFDYDLEDYYRHQARLQPGAKVFLDQCQAASIPVIALSDASSNLAGLLADRTNCADALAGIISTADGHLDRTEPAFYQQGLADIEADPDRVWVVEDHIDGLRTAHRAGFTTIAIPAEGQDAHEWSRLQAEADQVVESLEALKDLVK